MHARNDIHALCAPTPASRVGTPPEELDRIERDLGFALPPEVRDFYLGASQLMLAWQEGAPGKSSDVAPAAWSDLCSRDSAYWREHLRPLRDPSRRGGVICIPTAAVVFRHADWVDGIVPDSDDVELTIDGETIDDTTLYDTLFPFDLLNYYYMAALWRNPANGAWRVVLADDHGACWTDYETVSVADYFDQLERGLGGLHTFKNHGEAREIWGLSAE